MNGQPDADTKSVRAGREVERKLAKVSSSAEGANRGAQLPARRNHTITQSHREAPYVATASHPERPSSSLPQSLSITQNPEMAAAGNESDLRGPGAIPFECMHRVGSASAYLKPTDLGGESRATSATSMPTRRDWVGGLATEEKSPVDHKRTRGQRYAARMPTPEIREKP